MLVLTVSKTGAPMKDEFLCADKGR